jgi:hypothetical protein
MSKVSGVRFVPWRQSLARTHQHMCSRCVAVARQLAVCLFVSMFTSWTGGGDGLRHLLRKNIIVRVTPRVNTPSLLARHSPSKQKPFWRKLFRNSLNGFPRRGIISSIRTGDSLPDYTMHIDYFSPFSFFANILASLLPKKNFSSPNLYARYSL